MHRIITMMTVLCLTNGSVCAAPPAVNIDWDAFQQRVAQQRLNNRAVWISLRTGERIKLFLKKTSEDGLVVHANGRTKEWNLGKGEAKVPRAMIQSVRFTGKVGRGGLIGGLAGLGAGGALIGAAATGESEGYVRAASLLAPILFGVGGYFIGSVFSPSAPAFVFE